MVDFKVTILSDLDIQLYDSILMRKCHCGVVSTMSPIDYKWLAGLWIVVLFLGILYTDAQGGVQCAVT